MEVSSQMIGKKGDLHHVDQKNVTAERAFLGCQNFILDFSVNENCLFLRESFHSAIYLSLKYQYDVFFTLTIPTTLKVLLSHMCAVMHFYLFYGSFPICRKQE